MRPIAPVLALLTLAACSAADTLEPVGAAPPVPVAVPAAPVPGATATAASATPAAPAALAPTVDAPEAFAAASALGATHLEIAPVTGAPRGAVGPLSRAMAARGQEIGLDFTRGEAITTHTLRGFFSVNDDGGEVRVVYIWDVVTPDGRRVHRIRGQEAIAGTVNGADPWSAVSPDVMARIGARTVDRFADWRRG